MLVPVLKNRIYGTKKASPIPAFFVLWSQPNKCRANGKALRNWQTNLFGKVQVLESAPFKAFVSHVKNGPPLKMHQEILTVSFA
jgi:hypothetical protein